MKSYLIAPLGCLALCAGCFDSGQELDTADANVGAADVADGSMTRDVIGADASEPEDTLVPDAGADVCVPAENGERCDGLDNDCDGEVDDGFQFGVCTVGLGACEAVGELECADEQTTACNATPGSPTAELCGDGIDNDCDGQTDEDDADDAATWFVDKDGDGFGDPNSTLRACDAPAGHVSDGTDCDDTDATVYQSLTGYMDQDGDGYTAGAQNLCTDGSLPDGYSPSENTGDCDDSMATINPGADEVCDNGVDNDCDGRADDSTAVDATFWYIDCDGDGFSADSAGARRSCSIPTASTGCGTARATWTERRPGGSNSTDCNDDVADAFPGQTLWFLQPMGSNPYSAQIQDWDYNCDGSFNFRWENTGASCQQASYGMCSGSAGWVSQYNYGCGGRGDFQLCDTSSDMCNGLPCNFSCDSSVIQRTQECH